MAVLVLALALLPLPGAVAEEGAETPDPDALESEALRDPSRTDAVRIAMRIWLSIASRHLGASEWEAAEKAAERAVVLFHAASRGGGIDEPLAPEMGMARMTQGRVQVARGELRRAAAFYREGAGYFSDPRAWISAGDLSGQIEEWEDAKSDYTRALELPGVDPSVHLRLAEALYHTGATAEASQRVRLGIEAGAPEAAAKAMLERFEREHSIEGGYASGGSLHFGLSFEDLSEHSGVRQRVLGSLERVYDRVTTMLQFQPRIRVPVVLYASASTYRSASGAPGWTMAAYNGKIRIPIGELEAVSDPELDRILAHEFAHYLVERLAGTRCPAWLQEGIAQHAEADGREPTWMAGVMRPYLKRLGKGKPSVQLRQLEARFHGLQGSGVHVAYGISYYAFQYLLETGAWFRVQNLLAALKSGSDPAEALEAELFVDYDELDRHWVETARRRLNL